MNCEQRYNNALERARIGLHDCNLLDCDDMTRRAVITTIYHLFPELIEDEDERIRKGIIRNLQYLMDRSEGFVKEDLQERIAWLEKQNPAWSEKDKNLLNRLIGVLDGTNEEDYHEGWEDKFVPWLKSLKERMQPQQFEVKDWVILNGIVAQILDKQKYGFVGLDTDGKDFFCNYGHTDSMRLWTISDAENGDVLLEEETGEPFIYNGNRAIYFSGYFLGAYCGIYNGKFNPYGNTHHWGENSCPATKEQRDLLFAKMHDAGYAWDSEKKELKKIEPKTLNADKVIEWINNQACQGWIEDVEVDKFIEKFKKDFGL